jgi:hypothetical protein
MVKFNRICLFLGVGDAQCLPKTCNLNLAQIGLQIVGVLYQLEGDSLLCQNRWKDEAHYLAQEDYRHDTL